LGRIDSVKRFVDDGLDSTVTVQQRVDGFALACSYGHADVVDLLLRRGVEVDAQVTVQGEGHTGLHTAAVRGHLDVVDVLLRWGASVDVIDKTWGTTPLVWALTGWSREPPRMPATTTWWRASLRRGRTWTPTCPSGTRPARTRRCSPRSPRSPSCSLVAVRRRLVPLVSRRRYRCRCMRP
jgi:hypothetical protein